MVAIKWGRGAVVRHQAMGVVELMCVVAVVMSVATTPCVGEQDAVVEDPIDEPYKVFPALRRQGQIDVQYLQNAIGWYYVLVTGVACLAAATILVSLVRMCVYVCASARGYRLAKKSA